MGIENYEIKLRRCSDHVPRRPGRIARGRPVPQ
jgi:hypothetical protein